VMLLSSFYLHVLQGNTKEPVSTAGF